MNVGLKGVRILMLQGPNGPFFARLSDELERAGAQVDKIHLNLAERFFHGRRPGRSFRGSQQEWPGYLEALFRQEHYHVCFYFGDLRPYHVAARPVLERHDIVYFVFEDGYLRPDFVTVEEGGVNYRSALKADGRTAVEIARDLEQNKIARPPRVTQIRHAFAWSVLHTIANSIFVTIGRPFYPGYRHHRDVNTVRQALLWGRSFVRKAYYHLKDRTAARMLLGAASGKYFLAGLQVYNDSQIKRSRFEDVRDFIQEVTSSFARFAPPDALLVFKHHPADRAYRNYTDYILDLVREFRLEGRVFYVHDVHLPTLLAGARGTVVINSTIGWSSLHHGTPVYALDETTYGYLGLTARGTLADFWQAPEPVAEDLVAQMQVYLRSRNQANGSVWTRLPGAGPTGFRWPPHFEARLEEIARSARSDAVPASKRRAARIK